MANRRSEETRERILKVSLEAFAENGYDATGVAEICQRAQVSKGAFYYHFPSKQDVFLALMGHWLSGLDTQLDMARAGAETIPEEFLQMAGMARLVFEAAEDQLPIFLEFWAKASRDPGIWKATIAPYRRYRDYFVRMFEAGIEEGTIRPIDPQKAAYALVALASGLILQGLLEPETEDWGMLLQEGVEMLLKGLRVHSE
jgi:AcrR family transcriptional regulator